MKEIMPKINWNVFFIVLFTSLLGGVSNENIANIYHALLFGAIMGIIFGFIIGYITRN